MFVNDNAQEIAIVSDENFLEAALFYQNILPINASPQLIRDLGFTSSENLWNKSGTYNVDEHSRLIEWQYVCTHLQYNLQSDLYYNKSIDLYDKLFDFEEKYGDNSPQANAIQKEIDNIDSSFEDRFLIPVLQDYLQNIGHKNVIPVFSNSIPTKPDYFPSPGSYPTNVIPLEMLPSKNFLYWDKYPSAYKSTSDSSTVFEVSIKGNKFIDKKSLTFEHVLEMRKNKDLMKKFRNFRCFIEEDLIGKEKSYIEDKLSQKIDEYNQICNNEGLSLVSKAYSNILTSTSTIGTATGSIVSLLMGHPSLASLIALGGGALTLGDTALKFKVNQNEYLNKLNNHEVAYIIDLEDAQFNK